MKPYILLETNWKNIKHQKYEVAILPWGATEPHNYHLPYGTDSLETSKIAEDAAKKAWEAGAKIMVLPAIPLGAQNPGQIELPFCLHTRASTQKMILEDIVNSLSIQGIKKFILLNGHGGNDFKAIIREIQPNYPGMLISLAEWFKMLDGTRYFNETGDHAGEMETCIMQYYFPELVLPLDEAGDGKSKAFKLRGLNNKVAWAPRRWDKVSEDTGIGNPKEATPEKGKRFLDDLTTTIANFIIELGEADLNNLYE
ncbi:Creatinine amidohydrolase [hydrothermal vent metagenome]|uniref:Creatinine amidohydrolase n=1 Tax=hydrothermal vent metagenome TaxID=652676 RepID=A0A3B0TSX9_9ZZZZ